MSNHFAEAARIARRIKDQEIIDNPYAYRDLAEAILLICGESDPPRVIPAAEVASHLTALRRLLEQLAETSRKNGLGDCGSAYLDAALRLQALTDGKPYNE